jgi:hypothetical protein
VTQLALGAQAAAARELALDDEPPDVRDDEVCRGAIDW